MSARYHLAYLVGDHDAIYGEIVNISQKFCALIPKKKINITYTLSVMYKCANNTTKLIHALIHHIDTILSA